MGFSSWTWGEGLPPFEVDPSLLGSPSAVPPQQTPVLPHDAAPKDAANPNREPEVPVPLTSATSAQRVSERDLPFLPAGTVIEADRIRGERGKTLVAEGDVVVARDGQFVRAERLTYDEPSETVTATGAVTLEDRALGVRVTGPEAHYNLADKTGVFQQPRYFFTPSEKNPHATDAHGAAQAVYFEGANQYRIERGSWTTCAAPDPDWYLQADRITLDRNTNVGHAQDARLRFGDTTLVALPWLEFPLSKERKSGWLVPSFGVSSRAGVQVAVPYYFNLAPNYDLTLTPRIYTRRGLQLGSQFRYLTESMRGTLEAEVLPSDREAGRTRALGIWRHEQRFTDRLYGTVDYNAVGDRDYFKDLSNNLSLSSTVHLLRQGSLWYHGEGWGSQLLVQQYQTLDRTIETPYRLLPQWRLWSAPVALGNAGRFGTVTFSGQVTQFRHPDAGSISSSGLYWAEGTRWVATPEWRLPIATEWWSVEPRVLAHLSHYSLDQPAVVGGRTTLSRALPIVALDARMAFERDWQLFGRNWLQTLEPRLFYRYAPYRDQSDFPLFDTDRYGFGFAQLFMMNPYTGYDRVADGHSVTVAVTSRLLEPETGRERIRASLAQRFYRDDPKVLLPGEAPWSNRRTDLLAEVVWQPFERWRTKGFWQYDPDEGVNRRFNVAVRYEAGLAKVAGFDYRYTRDQLEEVALSGQWPLAPRWYGVSRIARSLQEDRWTELLAGFEYNGGCWVGRVVLHRYALSSASNNTAIFFQLELNGLGSLGNDPGSLLRRAVPGYGRIAPTGPERSLESGW